MLSILYSDIYLNHDTGIGHPESPDRISACAKALRGSTIVDELDWILPRSADIEELELVHTAKYIESVKAMSNSGGGYMDPDTPVCSDSYEIARLSAGAWLQGVDDVMQGERSSFVLSRPPGHHAESARAMGFCLFSNCALAAEYAIHSGQAERVAIFDWDVHHGNGTQEIVEKNPDIAYCSIHQYPFYPGTGSEMEMGLCNNVRNIPMPAGSNGKDYLGKFDSSVLPFIQIHEPDLIIVSAGFDAALEDPLGGMKLSAEDFAEMTHRLLEYKPNLLLGLEGGYSLEALGNATVAVSRELLGHAR